MNLRFSDEPLTDIEEKVRAGARLSAEDGLRLYRARDLIGLGRLAQTARRRLHGDRVFYSANLHLNYSNVCSLRCAICAFAKRPGEPDAYTLDLPAILDRIRMAGESRPVNEVHIVGGQHPDLEPGYYIDMVRAIRSQFPDIYIKALTASEIAHVAVRWGLEPGEFLGELKKAGLDGLAGGGAEIFAEPVRKKICPGKITADEWLAVHRRAHERGLRSNASMLYGHIETDEDRVDHVLRLRALQDETRGFYSFVLLAYKSGNNSLGGIGECGGNLDLRVCAVSRLLLDNIPHIKAHWPAVGLKMAQVMIAFGADDLGGLNLEEKVMKEAGATETQPVSFEEIEALIREAGCRPCRVDSSYLAGAAVPAGR